ncbi:SNF2-related protein [Methylococcus capsulatus]|uniref:SNF2-related protein n=2 Tax=Methylococcus TaxID=413 RepID=UPI002A675A75|nr:hypothetical protein [Methylococcus capsulatus]
MTPQLLTPHQSQYIAWLLTRRAAGDTVESLASTLVDSQVDLNPHQVEAALFACRNPLSRGVILADEVGLGKTIEAGLVISQRWAERRRRILIIVPANLRKQWHQELQDKFGLQGGGGEGPVFTTETEKEVARVVMDVIGQYEVRRDRVPTSNALLKPEVQKRILAEVAERLKPRQGEWLSGVDESAPTVDLAAVVAKTTEILVQQTIDIPRISVVPKGEVTTGFHPFTLDVSQLHLQPGTREIVIHNLHTNEQDTLASEIGPKEQRPEDYIVHALVDFDDIDYFTQADLLYDLASQMVRHLQSYLTPDEVIRVPDRERRLIAREIHAQMMAHFWEEATEYEAQVSRGFTELKPCNYSTTAEQRVHHFRETVLDSSRIKQMLFGGFARCLYPLQKFDSDTERRFAIILERDANKWFKPAKGQFQIFYKLGTEQPEYIPDFVAETDSMIFMVETKARGDINTQEVQAKAAAAVQWCKHASAYTASIQGKPWKYLLLPHDEVKESRRLTDFLRFGITA